MCLLVSRPALGQLNLGPPKEVENVTVEQKLGGQIPLDISLTDSLGRAVKTGYYFDSRRPVLVTLNYSDCPVLCNVQLNALVASLNDLDLTIGGDFQILTVSINPRTDRANPRDQDQVCQSVDPSTGAAEGWHFCTARESSIQRLADSLGFRYTFDKQTGQYYHPAMLAFVSPEGIISRYSLDVAFPPNRSNWRCWMPRRGRSGRPWTNS